MRVVLLRIRNRSVYSNFLNKYASVSVRSVFKVFYTSPLAHLFIPTPSRLLWEALSHAAVTARRPFVRIITTAYSQILIHTNEWAVATFGETNCQSFETAARRFKLGFSRLGAWRSIWNVVTPHSMGEKEKGQRRSEEGRGGSAGGRYAVCLLMQTCTSV